MTYMEWFDTRIAELEQFLAPDGEHLNPLCVDRARAIAETWAALTGNEPFVTVIYDGEIQIEDDDREVEVRADGSNRWYTYSGVTA